MKFAHLQALKQKAYQAFLENQVFENFSKDPAAFDSLSLAFIGDAYYSLCMRKKLITLGIPHIQVTHLLAAEFVSAKCQSFVYRHMQTMLTEMEKKVCLRARNAHSQVPKSASVQEYKESTALEALLGYVIIAQQEKRKEELMKQIMLYVQQYCEMIHGRSRHE